MGWPPISCPTTSKRNTTAIMARRHTPSRHVVDGFVLTISDNDDSDYLLEEEIETPPPAKKAKKTGKAKRASASQKGESGAPAEAEDETLDPDFHISLDDGFGEAEFDGWGFEAAKKGMASLDGGAAGGKSGAEVEEIIRRRREQKEGKDRVGGEDDDGTMVVDVDLDEEVLAEDGFGMGVGSDVEESDRDDEEMEDGEEDEEDNGEDNGEDDEAASDDDSVATPVQHPDDDASGDDDDEDDAEEEAKRRDFFATPEEVAKSAKKGKTSTFLDLGLSRPILRGLTSVGFDEPTPIQAKTIPIALMGKDVVGGAVTGSGKTAAFMVPILERLLYRPNKIPMTRVVVLAPTRELAIQCHAVATKLATSTDIKFCLAVGGLSRKVQEAELRLRPDVVIATPGRFIDHMRNSPSFAVEKVEILVLDEADRMLEDGFADELNEILTTLPKSRQTMLFSATMTSSVDNLIRVGLTKPVRIMVDSQKSTAGTLVQEFVRLRPGREKSRMGYLVHICKNFYTKRVIIFFRQKKMAHRTRVIFGLLGLSCAELHGSMNQTQVWMPCRLAIDMPLLTMPSVSQAWKPSKTARSTTC